MDTALSAVSNNCGGDAVVISRGITLQEGVGPCYGNAAP